MLLLMRDVVDAALGVVTPAPEWAAAYGSAAQALPRAPVGTEAGHDPFAASQVAGGGSGRRRLADAAFRPPLPEEEEGVSGQEVGSMGEELYSDDEYDYR